MGDTSRLLSTSLTNISAVSLGITPTGGTAQSGFTSTNFLFCHKELQASEFGKISTTQILPYYSLQFLPYSPNSSTPLAAEGTTSLTSSNIQLNVIPDKFMIAVRPQLSNQNWTSSASFFKINSVSILFNAQSGLLASLTQQQLFQLSKKNGYEGSYSEWVGFANGALATSTTSTTDGQVLVPTTGDVLFINPAYDLRLADWLSNSSDGAFNFVVTINITNQSNAAYIPELIIVYQQSGIMKNKGDMTSTDIGVLTKQSVIDVKLNQEPVLTSQEYEREVGGSFKRGALHKLLKRKQAHIKKMSGGGDTGGAMFGAMEGGGNTGGLARHIRKR